MRSLKTCILLLAAAGLFREASAAAQPNGLVGVRISCPHLTVRAPTNVPISVCITNASTNVVGVALPVCSLSDYEVWIADSTGLLTNIVPKPQINGPSVFRGTGFWQIYPGRSVGCMLDVPLDGRIKAGKHTLLVKRWCVIFLDRGPDGRVISSARKQLSSNPIEFEVR